MNFILDLLSLRFDFGNLQIVAAKRVIKRREFLRKTNSVLKKNKTNKGQICATENNTKLVE